MQILYLECFLVSEREQEIAYPTGEIPGKEVYNFGNLHFGPYNQLDLILMSSSVKIVVITIKYNGCLNICTLLVGNGAGRGMLILVS